MQMHCQHLESVVDSRQRILSHGLGRLQNDIGGTSLNPTAAKKSGLSCRDVGAGPTKWPASMLEMEIAPHAQAERVSSEGRPEQTNGRMDMRKASP